MKAIYAFALALIIPSVIQALPIPGCNANTNCGASCSALCSFGIACSFNSDCESGSCTASYCDASGSVATTFQYVPNSPTPKPPPPPPGGKWDWESDFKKGNINTWNIVKDSYGPANRAYVSDPAGSGDTVLRIFYPAGSINPGKKPVGGTGFYAAPIDLSKATKVTLQFDVYFPTGFQWVKGGKLPGLFGGSVSCSGGSAAANCFSTRFMFRPNGAGEEYLYVYDPAQVPEYCSIPPLTVCNPTYGDSIARGSWTWATGAWTTVSQTVRLNTFSGSSYNTDGGLYATDGVNNENVNIDFNKLVWRINPSMGFIGIDFETFFGGHDSTWASPTDQYTYFRNFKLRIDA